MNIIDLHQDLLMHLRGDGGIPAGSQTSPKMLVEAGVKLVVASVFVHPCVGQAAADKIDQDLNGYLELAERHDWQIIEKSSDIDDVLHGDRLGLLIHLEGLNYLPGPYYNELRRWHHLGLRSFAPVWNTANHLGGGCSDSGLGLSPLGHSYLRRCQRQNIAIDLAHANQRTFWNALSATSGPLLVSHANMAAVRPHQRNLTDDQLLALAERRGLVGICFVNGFVSADERATVADVADHLDHVRRSVGTRYVAIGSDFGGILGQTVSGLESIQQLPNLWEELANRGWDDRDIELVAWRNAARVLKNIIF